MPDLRRRERRGQRWRFFFFLAAVGIFGEAQLLFHLELEVVGGFAELVHQLADLTADLGQAPRPKDDERHHHQDERVGHAKAAELDWRVMRP